MGRIPYDTTLSLLIHAWRSRWDSYFALTLVPLANFSVASEEPGNNDPWPLLQDRMRKFFELKPNTGMTVINDVGDETNIHPSDNQSPGERLHAGLLPRLMGKTSSIQGHFTSLTQSTAIHSQSLSKPWALACERVSKQMRLSNSKSLARTSVEVGRSTTRLH
ncbi:hypothetical protein OAF37_04040 [Rubripirellula sp.]|nr:hypothetical protein [Rubripirellula sp.]